MQYTLRSMNDHQKSNLRRDDSMMIFGMCEIFFYMRMMTVFYMRMMILFSMIVDWSTPRLFFIFFITNSPTENVTSTVSPLLAPGFCLLPRIRMTQLFAPQFSMLLSNVLSSFFLVLLSCV